MALKLNRRPPFTTLATRLIWTTRSSSVSLFGSILANWSAPLSELEAGFAGGVGQQLDPPVVPEPGPVEDNLLDPRAPGALRDQSANGLGLVGLRLLGALLPLLARAAAGGDRAHRVDPFVIDRLTSCRRSCRPCRPCGESLRRGSGRPCPCRALACESP